MHYLCYVCNRVVIAVSKLGLSCLWVIDAAESSVESTGCRGRRKKRKTASFEVALYVLSNAVRHILGFRHSEHCA